MKARTSRITLVSLVCLALLATFSASGAQAPTPPTPPEYAQNGMFCIEGRSSGPSLNHHQVARTSPTLEDGTSIDKIVINGPPTPPPGYDRIAVGLPEPNQDTAINVLANVPAFDWSYGCSATSAAMIAGYYDRTGYANMYTGPTNGGVMPLDNSSWPDSVDGNGDPRHECPLSATHNGFDGRTIRGHVDDYWVAYESLSPDPFIGNWTEHTYGDCTGDYMKTNQSNYSNSDGSTGFWNDPNGAPLHWDQMEASGYDTDDGGYGLKLFYESRGYTISDMYNQYILGYASPTQGFTYDQYKAEIDAGRPVMIHVEGHTMVGLGYNDATNLMYIHDTWDYDTHTMVWGGSYSGMQHMGVTIVQLEDISPTAPTVTSITPSSGVNTGTVHITNLAGTNFLAGATVKLTKSGQLDINAPSPTVVSSSTITCNFDPTGSATGQWDVVVTNPDSQSGTLPNGFTLNPSPTAPTVTSITPSSGVNTGTVHITNLAGTNFQTGATVKLTKLSQTDVAGTSVTVVNSNTITCDFDLTGAATEQWNVVVTNLDSQSGMLANGFTVNAGGMFVYLPLVLRIHPPPPPGTFSSAGDACVMEGRATTNLGSTSDMWAGYDDNLSPDGKIVRSLIQFDVSAIPSGTSIDSAVLRAYLVASWDFPNKTRTITAYRIGSSWSESSVTWNTRPSCAEAYGSDSVTHGSWGWYSFDVTDLVSGWVNGSLSNYGVMLRGPEVSGSDSSWRSFYTREGSYPPQLEVTYSGYTTPAGARLAGESLSREEPVRVVIEALTGRPNADSPDISLCQPYSPAGEKCLALP